MFTDSVMVGCTLPAVIKVIKHYYGTLENCSKFVGFIYLFGVLRSFQHCTGHIMMGS